jgi:hypothetical protein
VGVRECGTSSPPDREGQALHPTFGGGKGVVAARDHPTVLRSPGNGRNGVLAADSLRTGGIQAQPISQTARHRNLAFPRVPVRKRDLPGVGVECRVDAGGTRPVDPAEHRGNRGIGIELEVSAVHGEIEIVEVVQLPQLGIGVDPGGSGFGQDLLNRDTREVGSLRERNGIGVVPGILRGQEQRELSLSLPLRDPTKKVSPDTALPLASFRPDNEPLS